MENKLKQQCQDSVGELPNLLLREGGYPHLPTTPIKQEPELTDWFDGEKFNPFHIGVYETSYSKKLLSKGFQLWDGKIWGQKSESVESAIDRLHIKGVDQSPFFRGIAKNPEVQP